MIFSPHITFFLLFTFISAYPVLERELCAQWSSLNVDSGDYTLFSDTWGESGGSGSQCAQLTSSSNGVLGWKTEWNWSGGNGIKSYANLALNNGLNTQLSAVTSIPSKWDWSYTNADSIVADVTYDFFTANADGEQSEIMIWLANYNSKPISYYYDANGQAIPTHKGLSIAGHKWDLYRGNNNYNPVYSFLPSGQLASFDGDLHGFFTYLIHLGYLSGADTIKVAEGGTEATSGSATFTTSAYSLAIKT